MQIIFHTKTTEIVEIVWIVFTFCYEFQKSSNSYGYFYDIKILRIYAWDKFTIESIHEAFEKQQGSWKKVCREALLRPECTTKKKSREIQCINSVKTEGLSDFGTNTHQWKIYE